MIKRKLLVRYEGIENALYPAESKDPHGLLDRILHFRLGAGS